MSFDLFLLRVDLDLISQSRFRDEIYIKFVYRILAMIIDSYSIQNPLRILGVINMIIHIKVTISHLNFTLQFNTFRDIYFFGK